MFDLELFTKAFVASDSFVENEMKRTQIFSLFGENSNVVWKLANAKTIGFKSSRKDY